MTNCNYCTTKNRLCPHYIISDSVSVTDDTLVIDLPSSSYGNTQCYCVVVRALPTTRVTTTMPVAFSIGGDATTLYPLVCGRTGLQAVACQVNNRSLIKVKVQTGATSGVFKALSGLNSYCPDVVDSLPITTATVSTMAVKTTAKATRVSTTDGGVK